MSKKSLYPPSPEDVPPGLGAPSSAYRMQTFMVLFALAMFFLLYFGVMAFCVAFSVWAIFLCPSEQHDGGFPWMFVKMASLMLVIPFGVLFLYMLKNLFKIERAQKDFRIELFEDEHPKLFEFIHDVCDEVGAPYPKHVYVDYLVNAFAMLETSSFFHMFLPTGKSLLIGLSLLNSINLTEFKALLAHEFGHFSQKSMKIGVYVYSIRGIVSKVVNADDWFDRFIVGWSRLEARIAWPAYIVRAILWVLRKTLYGMWYVVLYLDRALSRQMEFNADLIAVSATGSDAPVHLLHRCYIGQASFEQAQKDLRIAMSHHLYTSDMFFHQRKAVDIIRKKNTDPRLEEPPTLPKKSTETTQVFDEDDDKVAEMWATHPSNYDREMNAKRTYVRTTFDERSPWLLFDNAEELRERVTYKFYRYFFKIPKDVILADPEEIQGFIDDEHGDRAYDPRYQGLYDNRNLILKGIAELARDGASNPWSITDLSAAHATLYNAEVKHKSQLYYKHVDELILLTGIIKGWRKPKNDEVEFRGSTVPVEDCKRLLKKVDKDLLADQDWLAQVDRRVFMAYFQMALHIDQQVAEELYRRYDFHMELQNIWYALRQQNEPMQFAIEYWNALPAGAVAMHRFEPLLETFRDTHKVMKSLLKDSRDLVLPALNNLPVGASLRPFLLNGKLIEGLSRHERQISPRWVKQFLDQFREMKVKVDRVQFKSMAGILGLQERIGDECARRWEALPSTMPEPALAK